MRSFFDWWRSEGPDPAPWLILGKGPSFDLRHGHDLGSFRLLSLNHVVRELPVDAAHMIDIDVVIACADAITTQAKVLVMPWYPHLKNQVGEKTLADWLADLPVLRELDAQGRLLWYDLRTAKQRQGTDPVVRATYFSAEAALDLLAQAGVAKVRSLGVDGGAAYGNAFDDLKDVTRLNNGHPTYNLQFQGFAATIHTTGVDYAPLNIESPIRVYVGSQDEQMLSVQVLAHSIRRHTSMRTEVLPLHQADIRFPMPRDPKNKPRTPFSFQRFTIPQLAGYHGRAIYLDSDMLVFRDLRELWTVPFDGADVLAASPADPADRRPQFSVMLLDCERLHWTPQQVIDALDSGQLDYTRLMHEMALAREVHASIPASWNSLEHYEAGQTGLLHYTDMHSQPWVHPRNRWGHLWVRELILAIDSGFIDPALVQDHVDRGWVRPSLLDQVHAQREQPRWLPALERWRDRHFVAPYKKLGA
jgi:Glycosyl transferase family 8